MTQEPVGFPRQSQRPFLLYDDYVKPPQATPIYNPPIRPLTVFYNGCEFNFQSIVSGEFIYYCKDMTCRGKIIFAGSSDGMICNPRLLFQHLDACREVLNKIGTRGFAV
jgi:hypothetical protein